MGLPWQVGMGAIFWGVVGLLLLTIFPRALLDDRQHSGQPARASPAARPVYRHDGAENAGVIVVANPETLVSIGNLTRTACCWGSRILYYCDSASRNIHAVVSIIVTTLLWLDDGDVTLQWHWFRRHQASPAW